MLDKKEFGKVLAMLGEVFEKDITPSLLSTYHAVLAGYAIEDIKRATLYVLKTRKFNNFPKPAELIEVIEGDPEDKARLAWEEAHKAMIQVGFYKSVEFEDKVIHMVIESMGGWEELAQFPKDQEPFIRGEFMKLYKTYLKHPRPFSQKLVGHFDRVNNALAYDQGKPVLIGNINIIGLIGEKDVTKETKKHENRQTSR